MEDVAKRVLQHKADAVVFDDELSLAQQLVKQGTRIPWLFR